ncbi:MAG: hypothetical protein CMH54_09910 [Myxococcales bacterium]|nr:hypothetical protein [Myxococcales bacterium]|tara:strand:+ start:2373 stop:2648 length:276 start_codon:yes stop_codon:yes gene_type:complete
MGKIYTLIVLGFGVTLLWGCGGSSSGAAKACNHAMNLECNAKDDAEDKAECFAEGKAKIPECVKMVKKLKIDTACVLKATSEDDLESCVPR